MTSPKSIRKCKMSIAENYFKSQLSSDELRKTPINETTRP